MCLYGEGVKRNGGQAVKEGKVVCGGLCVFCVGLVEVVGKQFACYYFGYRFWIA